MKRDQTILSVCEAKKAVLDLADGSETMGDLSESLVFNG